MKITNSIKKLKSLEESLGKVLHLPLPKNRRNAVSHLTEISDTVGEFCDANLFRHRGLKRCTIRIRNILMGIATGVNDKAIGYEDSTSMLSIVLDNEYKSLSSIVAAIVEEEKRKEAENIRAISNVVASYDIDTKESTAAGSTDFKTAIDKAIRDNGRYGTVSPVSVKDEPQQRDEAIKDVQKYAKFSKNLPVRLKNNVPFTLVELPVVPIFTDFNLLSPKRLDSLKIKYSNLAGFYILEKQVILVFKKDELQNHKTKSQTKVIQENNDKRVSQALEYVDILNERSPIKFSVVGNKVITNPENPKLALMWLMPKRTVSKLQTMAGAKGLKLDYWGFPWDINKSEI